MRIILAAGALLGVSMCASLAYAQTLPQLPAFPQFSDPILQQDFQLFQKFDIGTRFGIQFKPHAAVCSSPQSGSASCNARVITDSKGDPQAQPGPSGYAPAQFLQAYGLSGTVLAAKPPIIAIVDAYDDPNITADLSTYDSQFGLPQLPACSGAIANSSSACFEKANQTGSTVAHPTGNSGWDLEISLDVEIAHATCQNCSILLLEANSSSYADLMTAEGEAVALGANVVSNSYGGSEFSGETSYDPYFNHPGVAFVASAGDSGYGVEYPAASPYVTAVGGTSLYLNSDGSYNNEIAWSGTGSGCSAFETKPSWQTDAGCSRRTVADVSADADPNTGAAIYDSVRYGGVSGWFQVGGTSLASPLVAATYAQTGNIPSGTQENSLPYANLSALHDVTSGSNGSCGGSYLCTAAAGYDGPTGLGSPNGSGAFTSSSASSPPPPPQQPTVTISANPTTITLGQSATVSWSSTNATSCTASNAWSGTEAVSGSQSVTPGSTGTFTYVLSCMGAGGSANGSATVTVNPAPVQGFSLTASPPSLNISRGRQGSDTITLVPSGGFAGTVALSVSGLPSGATGTFRRGFSSSSVILTISLNNRVKAGTYQVNVTGTSGSLSNTIAITLKVN